MLLGMKESYKKGESESILAPSLAVGIARCWLKRRQGYRWAGGPFSAHLALYTTLGGIVEWVAGALAGAALYQEAAS